ncbi:MAG: hypothetical protein DRJ68_03650 [Thermoprotei archaeon]|nr:MAG: hypothetical protein DRJ62_02130 [Thermoprotei archaeon]RLF21377.1 MAG: hypothetical protein DRJ68_03650 [Thermoprotei archaeon]
MIYLDTNVLIAYINPKDALHRRAVNLLSRRSGEGFVASQLVVLELYSVFSRVMSVSDEELEALVNYTIKACGVEVVQVEWDEVYRSALSYANKLKLKVLDLLHVVVAQLAGAKTFMSFDRDINSMASVIEELLDLRVIGLDYDRV